jgi:hypothetical protein
MATPISPVVPGFEEYEKEIAKNQPEYLTLPAISVLMPITEDSEAIHVLSCWQLTPEDLEKINQTGKIWVFMTTFGGRPQPLRLDFDCPALAVKEKEQIDPFAPGNFPTGEPEESESEANGEN